jgi:hypothetical protein
MATLTGYNSVRAAISIALGERILSPFAKHLDNL